MSEDDKYPAESGRRRFVKGVVGGGALAGVGAAGSATVNSLTSAGGIGGGSTVAMAIERTGGPAPRGMPQIPIEITDDGHIRGIWPEVTTRVDDGIEIDVAEMELGGRTYSQEWFQYCGMEGYENLDPNFESDNLFRSDSSPSYEWQADRYDAGEPVHVDDFDDYQDWGNTVGNAGVGKPATVTWRSEDSDDTIPATVIRSDRIEEAAQDNEWLEASTEDGFIAFANVCTHFCCVPGYKETADSEDYDAGDGVYCPCHQSRWDPFSIVETLFIARPRPQ